jgi:CRP-like cAMP-binding protein
MTTAKPRPGHALSRIDTLARATPFSAWPRPVLERLLQSATVTSHRGGAVLVAGGQRCDALTVVVEGTALSSVSHAGGRRVTFKADATARAYGVLPLVDGQPMPNDLVADGPVVALRIPHAAIHAELARTPLLWQSVAADVTERARRYAEQMKQFVFDTPRVRAASLLLGLASQGAGVEAGGPVVIGMRLPQERFAEMLGISRQWATLLVREFVAAGLVEWRYGRVTLLDPQALQALAASGVGMPVPAQARSGGP